MRLINLYETLNNHLNNRLYHSGKHAIVGQLKTTNIMNYFIINVANPDNEAEFLELKGTCFCNAQHLMLEYIPAFAINWTEKRFSFWPNVTAEDVIKIQLAN